MLRNTNRFVWSISVAVLSAWIGISLLMAQDFPGKGPDPRGRRTANPAGGPPGFNPQGFPIGGPPSVGWSARAQFDEGDSGREAAIHELLEKFTTTAGEAERNKLADELEKIVGEQFDLRQKARADELQELEDQLAELRKLHDKRMNQKGMIVRERARQLLRDADGLGWNNNAPARGGKAGNLRVDETGRPTPR